MSCRSEGRGSRARRRLAEGVEGACCCGRACTEAETRQALLRVDPADGWLAAMLKNRRTGDKFQRVKKVAEFRPTKNCREAQPLVRRDDLNQTRTSAWLGVLEAWRGMTKPAGHGSDCSSVAKARRTCRSSGGRRRGRGRRTGSVPARVSWR
jgi:hypothetical protein